MKRILSASLIFVICSNFWLFKSLATEGAATRQANLTASALKSDGYNIRNTFWHGYLAKGDATYITTTLFRGNAYGMIVGGCGDAYDVDVLLYDENWNLISRDTTRNAWGVVTVRPRWTGKYYIKVRMYNSEYSGAHWSLLFAYV
jgi:hypothetical protein